MSKFYIPFCGTNNELQKCLLSIEKEQTVSCKYNLQTTTNKTWPSTLVEKITDIQFFWSKANYNNEYKVKLIFPKVEDNLLSASLALLLLPITKDNELLFNHICITGNFNNHYSTKAIDLIKRKFIITAENFSSIYSKSHNETFAFIYVSNNEEVDEQLIKKYPWINVKRFSEGISVLEVMNFLQTGFCYPAAKSNQFMDAVYQKIYNYLDSDSYNSADVTIFASGSENSECVYDRRLCLNYQRFIKQNKKLSLNINSTKSLDLYDLVSDAIVQNTEASKKMTPVWQQHLEKKNSKNIEKIIERLNRIHSDIENDISAIKSYAYDQENKHIVENLGIHYNLCNEGELIETSDEKIITPSFYHLILKGAASAKKEIIVWTDSYNLNYKESFDDKFEIPNQKISRLVNHHFSEINSKKEQTNSSKEILRIIESGKQNHDKPERIIKNVASYMKQNNLQFPKKFFITGLPGIGKTTSLYYIANHFDLDVISTEILINYYIFNDDLAEMERINYERYWKDVDLNKLYGDKIPFYTQFSRKGYEHLSDNSEHMKQIREYACRIALELVEGTSGKAVIDAGGKEALTNFYYVLKQNGYKNIFITTEGKDEEEIFQNYLDFYKADKNLCNESRRNIKKLALKKYIDAEGNEQEVIDTQSKEFADALHKLIFKPRYKYYYSKRDYEIIRSKNEDIATTVLKILEVIFTE